MSAVPPRFNSSEFLYLNPQVAIGSNPVITVEQAIERYSTEFSNLPFEIPEDEIIKGPFQSRLYLADNHQDEVDVSSLNRDIMEAVKNIQSYDDDDAETDSSLDLSHSTFVPNLNLVIDRNFDNVDKSLIRLKFGPEVTDHEHSVNLSPSNVLEGDQIMLLADDGSDLVYAYVDSIPDKDVLKLRSIGSDSNKKDDSNDIGHVELLQTVKQNSSNFRAIGIRVLDSERIAHINFTKRFEKGLHNRIPNVEEFERFNPKLFQLLYPGAQTISHEQAFISLRQNWAANDETITSRIGTGRDIMHVSHTDVDFTMDADFHLNGNLVWNNKKLREVTDDFVRNYQDLEDCNTLITEYAIKRFVQSFHETRLDVNDLTVFRIRTGFPDGISTITEAIEESNYNVLTDDSTFLIQKSDLEINSNVVCTSAIAEEHIASTRWGIGGGQALEPHNNEVQDGGIPYNAYFANIHVKDSFSIGEHNNDEYDQWVCRAAKQGLSFKQASAPEHQPALLTLSPHDQSSSTNTKRAFMKVGGDIRADGTVLSLSDERSKHGIHPIRDPLQLVQNLRGCTFCYNDDPSNRRMGLIAQEVQKVIPECVFQDPSSGDLNIAYGNIVALLIEAIKAINQK